jgi:hypothetical protein
MIGKVPEPRRGRSTRLDAREGLDTCQALTWIVVDQMGRTFDACGPF